MLIFRIILACWCPTNDSLLGTVGLPRVSWSDLDMLALKIWKLNLCNVVRWYVDNACHSYVLCPSVCLYMLQIENVFSVGTKKVLNYIHKTLILIEVGKQIEDLTHKMFMLCVYLTFCHPKKLKKVLKNARMVNTESIMKRMLGFEICSLPIQKIWIMQRIKRFCRTTKMRLLWQQIVKIIHTCENVWGILTDRQVQYCLKPRQRYIS